MESDSFDTEFLIIGQGISGTVFSYILERENHDYLVVDSPDHSAATDAAAGIMNPITGKHVTLSWNYDKLYPIAEKVYVELCKLLDIDFLLRKPVVRAFKSQSQFNDWNYRSTQEKYIDYISEVPSFILEESRLQHKIGSGATNYSFQIPIHQLRQRWSNHLKDKKRYIEENFDYTSIQWLKDGGVYNGIRFKYLICCEGAQVVNNPYFNYLPFDPAKGEALIVEIENWHNSIIYKDNIFIAPWDGNALYWVGGTYAWKTMDAAPTAEKKALLLQQFKAVFLGDFKVIDQLAGLRPASKDRKPIVGRHPEFEHLYILNGMGTKGTSLSPYCSMQLYNHIVSDHKLEHVIDISRFS